MYILIIALTLIVLLLIGSPVIFAIGTAGLVYFYIKPGMIGLVSIYAHKFFTGMDSFVLLCIPLFIMAGEIMKKSGMMSELVCFSQMLVGRFRGGMAYVNVLASMIFGGISGSGLADISALGPIEISAMKEDGYDTAFAAALTATSAIQGPIIPPSIPMIIFASLTNASVGGLFLGGAIPGVMIGLGQAFVILILSRKKQFPKHEMMLNFREVFRVTRSAIYALAMPLIIIGGILGGFFTPTEAAAVAVGYSFIISAFVYRKIKFNDLFEILLNTAKTTTTIYLIIGFVSIISWVLAAERVPSLISMLIQKYNPSPYFLLFLINIFLLFNGMWISDIAQLALFAPLFTPILARLGIHPIHFGVVMVVNVMISMITPPYGMALYLSSAISKVELKEIVKEEIPFLFVSIVVLFVVTYFPQLILFLPRYFGFVY